MEIRAILVGTVLAAALANVVLKHWWCDADLQRSCTADPGGHTFPSGHVTGTTVLLGMINAISPCERLIAGRSLRSVANWDGTNDRAPLRLPRHRYGPTRGGVLNPFKPYPHEQFTAGHTDVARM